MDKRIKEIEFCKICGRVLDDYGKCSHKHKRDPNRVKIGDYPGKSNRPYGQYELY